MGRTILTCIVKILCFDAYFQIPFHRLATAVIESEWNIFGMDCSMRLTKMVAKLAEMELPIASPLFCLNVPIADEKIL